METFKGVLDLFGTLTCIDRLILSLPLIAIGIVWFSHLGCKLPNLR